MTRRLLYNLPNLLLPLALFGYSLPWLVSFGAGLQPNAYDLAEWLTLIPSVRSATPLLLPALLLRAPLVFIGIALALHWRSVPSASMRLVYAIILVLLFFSFVPPTGFFLGEFSDPNYQQQFALWLVYIAGVVAVSVVRSTWLHNHVTVSIALAVSLAMGLWGIIWSYQLLARYEVALTPGIGIVIYGFALGCCVLLFALRGTVGGRGSSRPQ